MECADTCRFCSILNGEKVFGEIDTPIIENEDYYLLSSIGAMVEGWSLVIPKKHEYSMKTHYLNPRFYDFMNNCIDIIKKAYKTDKVIVFEHGANRFGSETACGTNHCHIHIVPISDSLLKDITAKLPFQKTMFTNVNKLVEESEYLLYADISDRFDLCDCYVHVLKEPISQFFRHIIANRLGCPKKYNYKEHSSIDISTATFRALKEEIDNGRQ